MNMVILGTRGFPNVQGGVEKHCEYLSTNLVERGCNVTVLTRKPYVDGHLKTYKGVRLIALPAVRQKALETPLHTFIGVLFSAILRPDILHIQAIGPGLFSPLARMLFLRVVLTTHGSNYRHLKWGRFAKFILRAGELFGVTWADRIIAISTTIAEDIFYHYGKRPVVIPNGVVRPTVSTDTGVLQRYGLIPHRYILSVGRFVPEKGFHDLIRAFELFQPDEGKHEIALSQVDRKTHEDDPGKLKLVIVGDSDHPDEYSNRLKDNAMKTENVVLTGILSSEDLGELYSHASLFVLPSYYEGLSIALLEALSYGIPCIASDIPANREMMLPEKHYFNRGNVFSLSRKLKEFTFHLPETKERTIRQNHVLDRYDWGEIARRTLAVYEEIRYPTP